MVHSLAVFRGIFAADAFTPVTDPDANGIHGNVKPLPQVRLPPPFVCPKNDPRFGPAGFCIRLIQPRPKGATVDQYGIYVANVRGTAGDANRTPTYDCDKFLFDGQIAQNGQCCDAKYKLGKPVKPNSYSIQTFADYKKNRCGNVRNPNRNN